MMITWSLFPRGSTWAGLVDEADDIPLVKIIGEPRHSDQLAFISVVIVCHCSKSSRGTKALCYHKEINRAYF